MAANVVTFVAHLGEAQLVLNLLLPAASSLFAGAAECKLAERAPLAAKYSESAREIELLTGDQQDVSDHHHESQDNASRESDQESLEDAFKYTTAMRTVQVLGQVMRSQAGTLSAADKKQITETSISLSRRLMSVMYDAAEISADLIVRHASELFETEIKSNSVEARGLASRLIATVVGGIAKGLVCRAAEVFGTKDLVPLIETLDEAAKASKDLDNELIVLCARIVAEERYPPERIESLLRRLPDSDVLSRSALAHAVSRSFFYNPPSHAVRDSACARLGIQVRRIPARIHRDRERGRG